MDSTGRDLGAAGRGGALLGAGAALMVASGAWLAAADRPDGLVIAGVGLHLVLGVALLVPCAVWWWRRRERPLVRLGGALLLASGAAGCLLLALGNRDALRPLLWTHAVLALAGLASLLAAVAPARRGRPWWAAAGGLLLAVLAPGMALAWRSWNAPGALAAANPPPSRDAAGEAMGGAAGPFYPTRASTRDGSPVAARLFLAAQSCGRSGCHADLTRQWAGSAHRFSGLDNPWYRATFAQMRQARGVTASRWCAGCHAPATLLSGAADGAPDRLAATPLGRAGVSCTVCHAISRVKGTTGQADFELDTPALYRLALSDSALARDLYELLLRVDPALHRRSFSRPFTASAELCSTCHSVRMDRAANGYHWFRVADDYRDWQVSSVSGQGYLLVTAFPPPRSCTDCHMPKVRSADAGGRQGRIHSHRFASANTALPAWRGDAEQQAAVTSSLRSGAVTVDIFSMLEPPAAGAAAGGPPRFDAPLNRLPATLRRGDSRRIDVMVRAPGVGHQFPGGKADVADCWLELEGVDDRGRTVFATGGPGSPAASQPHPFRNVWVDDRSDQVVHQAAWTARTLVSSQLVQAGSAGVVHFRLNVPADAGDAITLTARLRYRKFLPELTRWAFLSLALPPPSPPVVTVASDTITLRIVAAGAAVPDMGRPRLDPPADYPRWNDYGFALLMDNDLRGSKAAFERAVALEPRGLESLINLALDTRFLGDPPPAKRLLAKALQVDPRSARAHFYLAAMIADEGRYDEALAHMRAAEARFPLNAETKLQIATLLFKQRDYRAAAETLTRAIAIDPQRGDLHFLLMESYSALHDRRRAEEERALYQRFTLDQDTVRKLTHNFLQAHPEVGHEEDIHEHLSVPLPGAGSPAPAARQGS